MFLSLNLKLGKVTTKSLYAAIRQAIQEGRLQKNEKLPSTRLLSKQLGIARNSVISVYERMSFEGWVVQKVGSGTYVNSESKTPSSSVVKKGNKKGDDLGYWGQNLQSAPCIIQAKNLKYDFTLGLPEHKNLAKHIWKHSRLSRLNMLTPEFALNSDLLGQSCLRHSICEYVRHSRGVYCEPEQVIITQGCQQALMLILMTLLSPDKLVSMEDPGYPVFHQQAQLLGAQIDYAQMDESGIIVDSIPSNTNLLYTTPSHQFPLGFAYSKKRKMELLRWAKQQEAIIVEDDYDSEYHYQNTHKQALKSLDKEDRVVMVGSFSKVLFPGIRLGYIIPPSHLVEPLSRMLWHLGRSPSVVSQIILDEFMRDGHFSYHLVNMNKIYKERYQHLCHLIDKVSFLERIPSEGGLHLAAEVKGCSVELSKKLEKLGVAIYPVSNFSYGRKSNAVLFGFGKISIEEMDRAFSIIRSFE